MLKHVSHHRSTSSMTRNSCSSLKVRGEPSPPKIIKTQVTPDDSELCFEPTRTSEVLLSSPEYLRKNLSSPESSCTSSDLGSPDVIRSTKSGRSQSLQSSPVVRRRLLDVPEHFESSSFSQDLLDVPSAFQNASSSHGSDEDPHSSPEVSKRDMSSPRASTLPRRGAQRSQDILGLNGQTLLRTSCRSADTCSIASTGSFSSLGTGKLSSRASSTSSLADQTVTPVKVYMRFMRPDIEYKTLRLSTATTCRQLIILLLAKFRLRHRDPNLFFVRMEITVRSPNVGAPTRRLLVLDDQARPAELQQCRPRGDARFSVGVRRGGLLRIHDSILMPGSQYKSLLVSYRTTSEELVQLLMDCYNSKECPRYYTVHEVNKCPYSDRQLRPDECPLLIQSDWPRPSRHNYSFVLRRNANYALRLKYRQMSWRRSLDQASTDTESEHEDHIVGIRKSRAPSLPITHTPSFKIISTGSLLSDSVTCSPNKSSSATPLSSTSSLSPSISRISCDSGFSSPSSSSRSSTASTGSPSPPASPSLSTNSKATVESRISKSSPSVSASLKSSLVVASSGSSTRVHQPVTVTVNQVAMSPQVTLTSASSSRLTPVHAAVIPAQKQDKNSKASLIAPSCILTIPLSPIPVPLSPPPLSVLSSSVVVTLLSPVSSSPVFSRSPRAKTTQCLLSSQVSVRTTPHYSSFFSSSEPPVLYAPEGSTIIPPSSAPPSPSSPTPSSRYVVPPSPSAPTSPCKEPQALQSTIITIPSSGPSVVSSNTLSSASAGMRELTAALESLRTLTIRCPNYDNCFYI